MIQNFGFKLVLICSTRQQRELLILHKMTSQELAYIKLLFKMYALYFTDV